MKVRRLALLTALLLGGGALAWWLLPGEAARASWRKVAVERQDVKSVITATGTLEAVTTVEVGTQVSGTIQELLVDFNDPVEEGQVVARIDTSLLEADVSSARAELALRAAELEAARLDLARTESLFAAGAATGAELEQARTQHAVAEAQVQSARVSLERAQRGLRYATITSPVTGTVVARDVEVGQTVNAGMSAPRLFLIAGDLARMEILASVDEADIGSVSEGQKVEFTVAAFPRDTFQGQVRQVRLQSTTVENVVNYTVVVEVDNADRRLLPGMTANLGFIVDEAPAALCVPNAALRFRPDPALLGERPNGEDAGGQRSSGRGEGRGRPGGAGQGAGTLWLPAAGGGLTRLEVQTGLVGATCTEVSGPGVVEGLEVVAGVERGAEQDAAGANPLQPSGRGFRPGGF